MRRLLLLPLSIALLALAACMAPMPDAADAGTAEAAADDAPANAGTAAQPDRRAPPMSDPLPPQQREREPERDRVPANGDPSADVDTTCRRDADCAIKDVGSCCGARPACVNVDAATDPDAVQAACAEQGRMSICGFPTITSCQCVQDRCEGGDDAAVR